ncbi:MAG: aminopeptidase, partial [Burkholderiales bacterium]
MGAFRQRGGPIAALGLAAALAAGCASVDEGLGYYWQSVSGHLSVMWAARPLPELIDAPETGGSLRARLERARAIRAFASERLGLPENGSYRSYADLGRRYVVWNVFAAPELSLQLKRWCFPIAGCVSYRGYYDQAAAERYAASLREQGWDVYVAGVPAYSTLG